MGVIKFRGIFALVGPKHTGKSTCARELAALCSGRFTDLDDEIVSHTGKTPRELFIEGPEIFREAEQEALVGLMEREGLHDSPLVLATGGGIIDNFPAFSLLREASVLVYLEVPAETAWRRVVESAHNGGLPPFLGGDNPENTHRELHCRRALAYRRAADIVLDASEKSPEVLARAALGEIKKRWD